MISVFFVNLYLIIFRLTQNGARDTKTNLYFFVHRVSFRYTFLFLKLSTNGFPDDGTDFHSTLESVDKQSLYVMAIEI